MDEAEALHEKHGIRRVHGMLTRPQGELGN